VTRQLNSIGRAVARWVRRVPDQRTKATPRRKPDLAAWSAYRMGQIGPAGPARNRSICVENSGAVKQFHRPGWGGPTAGSGAVQLDGIDDADDDRADGKL
jgi:hypothetical protein